MGTLGFCLGALLASVERKALLTNMIPTEPQDSSEEAGSMSMIMSLQYGHCPIRK